MKARHGINSIPLPAIQRSPAGIGRLSIEVRKALAALRDRKIIVSNPRNPASKRKPLDVIRLRKEESAFIVNVAEGYVIERTVKNAEGTDCITYHEPDNLKQSEPGEEDPPLPEGVSAGDLVDHEVEGGQAIYCKVTVEADGTISATEITVSSNDEKSIHYEPPIGEGSEGAQGFYWYKLAKFETDGDTLKIIKFHAGSNIDHFQELPRFETAGGNTIWKEWDAEAGKYKTKGIDGIRQITTSPGEDKIEIGGNDKNLKVRFIESGASSPGEDEDINFEDGLNTDGEVGAEEVPNRDIILPIVQGLSPILVQRSGAGNRTFTVSLEEAESGDNFNIKLLNVSITESGGEIFVSDIGWGTDARLFYVRGGKLFLTDDAAVVDTYEVISRIQGEDFSVNPGNQSGDGLNTGY
jgi:hypothetical protein